MATTLAPEANFPILSGTEPCLSSSPVYDLAFERGPAGGNAKIRAKGLCGPCPTRDACLAWAMSHRTEGVWGGTDEDDRNRVRRQQRMRARPPHVPPPPPRPHRATSKPAPQAVTAGQE